MYEVDEDCDEDEDEDKDEDEEEEKEEAQDKDEKVEITHWMKHFILQNSGDNENFM